MYDVDDPMGPIELYCPHSVPLGSWVECDGSLIRGSRINNTFFFGDGSYESISLSKLTAWLKGVSCSVRYSSVFDFNKKWNKNCGSSLRFRAKQLARMIVEHLWIFSRPIKFFTRYTRLKLINRSKRQPKQTYASKVNLHLRAQSAVILHNCHA